MLASRLTLVSLVLVLVIFISLPPTSAQPVSPLVSEPLAAQEMQTTWYVDDDAPGGGDGLTWDTAFPDMQSALHAVALGDEIRVAGGTYVPSVPTDPNDPRTATFQLVSGSSVFGGYAGLADPAQPDSRDVALYETILSGDLNGDDVPPFGNIGENTYNVCVALDCDDATVLNGCTLTGGNADGPHNLPISRGGGLYVFLGAPKIEGCTFRHCVAYLGGGCCVYDESSAEVIDCKFTNNMATKYGGGFHNWNGTPLISGCYFAGNTAEDGAGAYSAGHADATWADCTFENNSATGTGGGLAITNWNDALVTDCTFRNCTARFGGGVTIYQKCSPTLIGCDILGNSARFGGGLWVETRSELELRNCVVANNAAMEFGGGIHVEATGHHFIIGCVFADNAVDNGLGGAIRCFEAGLFSVTNSVFSGNKATDGGAILSTRTGLEMQNSAFIGNVADNCGGAVQAIGVGEPYVSQGVLIGNSAGNCGGGIHGPLSVNNSILWGNYPDQLLNPAEAIYSDVQDGDGEPWFGMGCIDTRPQFPVCIPGIWTEKAVFDSHEAKTTFTDELADWPPNALVGGFLNPDTDQPLQSLVAANTETTITVWGGFEHWGTIGTAYSVNDYHLAPNSPCIDAGSNEVVPRDRFDLDGDGDVNEPIPFDLEGQLRFLDDPDTPDTGFGVAPIVDMGAYEFGEDCNGNGINDAVDIASGTSEDCDGDGVPDECQPDSDGDGVIDACDDCPDSNTGETIVIDGCDTEVANQMLGDGCTMADLIAECAANADTHGDFVSCVAHLTNSWKHDGLISGREKGQIQRCAAQADIPGGSFNQQFQPSLLTLDGLGRLLANYGATQATYEDGDMDSDGDVDLNDLSVLLATYETAGD